MIGLYADFHIHHSGNF